MKAIALDDEPRALDVIKNFCDKTEGLELLKVFTKPNEALAFLQENHVDLIFLDIQMPSHSGLNLGKMLPREIMVVFTTAFSEYAVESYNIAALDYLLKPFTFERFSQTIAKAEEHLRAFNNQEGNHEPCIFIRADYSLKKVLIEDILYIEGLDDYIKIILQDQKPIVARMTMKSIFNELKPHDFIRVHRSYIVPRKRIEQLRNKFIQIAGKSIPIGKSYEKEFFANFKR